MVVDALARFFNRVSQRQQDELLFEALFDERLARDLMSAKRVPEDKDVARRMNSWLVVLGIPNVTEIRFPQGEIE